MNNESGGAETFTKFIEEELIPYIDSKYPTMPYRTLIGHSYAGLFTINMLLNHKHLFSKLYSYRSKFGLGQPKTIEGS